MTKKSGGPPKEQLDEEPWQPPEAEEPLQRSLDLALQRDEEESNDDDPEFLYGDIVHDTESEEPIAFVVVNIPDITAEEWEFEDGTLADRSKKYPDDDYVVVVTPLGVLDD